MIWPFGDLRPLSADLIVADPAWEYVMWGDGGYEKAPQAHYDCMTVEEICALPVNQLARGDCVLFLWTTWPFMPVALQVMDAWGFTYKTGGAWRKVTRNGKVRMGPGYIVRSACEPWLIGTIGEPRYGNKSTRNLIDGLAREHSRKPDEAYAILERLVPATVRVDLFARQQRPGWHAWGNETTKFGAAA